MAALLAVAGCQTTQPPQGKDQKKWEPRSVALLPVERVAPDADEPSRATCPLNGSLYTAGPMAQGAELSLAESLQKALKAHPPLRVVPVSQAGLAYDQLYGRQAARPSLEQIAKLGAKLQVDAVLVGFVYRFTEREGSEASAEKPAAVTFNLLLVRSTDGMIAWSGVFDQQQQALSQNLLDLGQYMKYGLRWYSADELGQIGAEQALESFPWPQQAAVK
ncbi:hypothetical protein Deba_1427 [Desulfarculus baarsii DSM 2075]|uniref:Lipoprotein n=1 Tax=Desulfarculus baarsii (strain ATCC 33931 / DSM 2075 / LMG 7858 / VKM B-1802 / 2st14) TaxID=644282 RepID=E1QGV2_DESB2|nr:hypothetical protein [Desulfarculus baarsii]ADK84795.1 hypothetical protein Deba_1427 [Desulfarculus baarsii DSM 2075]